MLVAKNIGKRFGEKQALSNVSFSLENGTVLGLLGRNGAGKTTLLRTIIGIYECEQGELLYNNKPLIQKNLRFGYLPEERGLFPKEKVGDQIVLAAELSGMSKAEAKKKKNEWLENLYMTEYEHKYASQLSKGNQQKIQLITALIHDPDIIILDEPFSGLDPVNAEQIEKIITDYQKKNKLIIFSTHRMEHIEQFCKDIVVLDKGECIYSGTIEKAKVQHGYKVAHCNGSNLQGVLSKGWIQNQGVWMKKLSNEEEEKSAIQELEKNRSHILEWGIRLPNMQELFVEMVGEDS